jgi:hypothetical protein
LTFFPTALKAQPSVELREITLSILVQLYVENLSLGFWPHYPNFGEDFRIRPVFQDEQARLKKYFFADFDTAAVIEKLSPLGELEKAKVNVRSVFQALLLYEDRLLRWRRVISEASNLVAIDPAIDMGRFVYVSRPLWRFGLGVQSLSADSIGAPHVLPMQIDSKARADKFAKFAAIFTQLPKPEYFQMAIDHFAYATDLVAETNQWPHRLIQYVTSMEALLTQNEQGISYKLPMRMVSLLGGSKNRYFIFQFMREAYDIRSKLVHGVPSRKLSKVLPMRIDKKTFTVGQVVEMLHSLCQQSLRSVFGHLCSKSIDKKKCSLTELLDRRLITR